MTSNKVVVGIISYFPDSKDITNARRRKLNALIHKCLELFNLPIMIVAQNWKSNYINIPEVTVYNYPDKLGIVGARKELRKLFLKSDYDYLIMLDDDCELVGRSGESYLKQIDDNPGCFIEFNKTLFKLFAISKSIFEKVDFEDIHPEKGEGFEDRIFVNKLRTQYPDYRREFKDTHIEQHSISTADPLSTWYIDQNIGDMLNKTFDILNKINC